MNTSFLLEFKKEKTGMVNDLAAIARPSCCMAGNNALRAYKSSGGKKIFSLIVTD